jgi:catechol 2,3-dioxygenase-like lactoylglutathione lyase family enzyme
MTIVGTHHTCYQVADLARSLAFYRDLLGFEQVWERVNQEEYVREITGQPGATLHQAMLRFPGSDHMLELIDYRGVERKAVDTTPVNPGTAHCCLLVTDFQETYDRLIAAGVPSVSDGPVAVTSGPNEGRLAVYMIDPDGFPLELLEVI